MGKCHRKMETAPRWRGLPQNYLLDAGKGESERKPRPRPEDHSRPSAPRRTGRWCGRRRRTIFWTTTTMETATATMPRRRTGSWSSWRGVDRPRLSPAGRGPRSGATSPKEETVAAAVSTATRIAAAAKTMPASIAEGARRRGSDGSARAGGGGALRRRKIPGAMPGYVDGTTGMGARKRGGGGGGGAAIAIAAAAVLRRKMTTMTAEVTGTVGGGAKRVHRGPGPGQGPGRALTGAMTAGG
mmetsp:Transcript_51358/g.154313  ORF Transcript_51358/g.154313 Transcript_51358/m.154313 type:complete len:242 (+) Transcript_51358:307-1032(+)